MAMSRRSVHLTTLFYCACLTKLPAKTCASNRQQPFLNQRPEENDCRNYFMINLNERMGPGQVRKRDPWIQVAFIDVDREIHRIW